MRKLILLSILLAMTAAPALAGPTATVVRTGGYYSGSGGEFTVTPSGDWSSVMNLYDSKALVGNGFQTFCLEAGETINADGTTVYDIVFNDKAIRGGVGPAGDPISLGTAWLYHDFQLGVLSGYNYTAGAGRAASALALQDTIWWLEGEASDPGAGNVFRNAAITKFGTSAAAMADNNLTYAVAVLNFYYQDGRLSQDMLVCIPAPGAILLGGIGVALVGWMRRRKTL